MTSTEIFDAEEKRIRTEYRRKKKLWRDEMSTAEKKQWLDSLTKEERALHIHDLTHWSRSERKKWEKMVKEQKDSEEKFAFNLILAGVTCGASIPFQILKWVCDTLDARKRRKSEQA